MKPSGPLSSPWMNDFIWMNVIFAWVNLIYDLDKINKCLDEIHP